jgi:chloramphenicol 3-O-phosphotransferase
MTLEVIAEAMTSANVLVDGAWTEQQVTEAKRRFGASGLFTILRIDEAERQRREASRTDRHLTFPWDPAWSDMPGPDSIYDLVLDSGELGVGACADAILAEYTKRWGDPP